MGTEWLIGGVFLLLVLLIMSQGLGISLRALAVLLPIAGMLVVLIGFAIAGFVLVFEKVHHV